MKAIIGGTGINRFTGFSNREEKVNTPYGPVDLYVGTGKDVSLVFLPRHGKGHDFPPHLVDYRAHISALKQIGVSDLVGIYAVGSITDFIKPGEACVVDDFIDFTSGRANTFFTGGVMGVHHVSMDEPFSCSLQNDLLSYDKRLKKGGVYATTNGPRLETKAEIRALASLGADYVGMTLGTEATLAKEAGLHMAAIAYSINWAAGIAKDGMGFLGDEETEELAFSLAKSAMRVLV